jgi:hypothetical protein
MQLAPWLGPIEAIWFWLTAKLKSQKSSVDNHYVATYRLLGNALQLQGFHDRFWHVDQFAWLQV